jgi:sialate O-acetylesterase
MNTPAAALRLAPIFSDGAILAADEPLPVFGRGAAPHARIEARLGDAAGISVAGPDGAFLVWLPALPAGGPHRLAVRQLDSPDIPPAFADDIWLGDVWLAAGQSNMQMTAGECGDDAAAALADASDTLLRVFTVERNASLGPGAEARGRWIAAAPETARDFSALAWRFARELRANLRRPVGMVVAAWGGTRIEAWCSRRALLQTPWRDQFQASELSTCSPEWWTRHARDSDANGLLARYPTDIGAPPADPPEARLDFDDSTWNETVVPGSWSRRGLGPLGVVWYRRHLTLPPAWRGRTLTLRIGVADKHDATYVNGALVGATGTGLDASPWNTRRTYRIPAALTDRATLTLAVRVFSFIGDGGLSGPAECMSLAPEENAGAGDVLTLAGPWRCAQTLTLPACSELHLPGHLNPNTPAILYDNLIAPLAPLPFRGVLWYQGEQNLSQAADYALLLRTLIADWRGAWGRPSWPFLIVQLPLFGAPAAYDPDSAWAALREAQRQAVESTAYSHLVAALDLGDAADIHPRHKAALGRRLALRALEAIYNCPRVARPVRVLSARWTPDALVLRLSAALPPQTAPVVLHLETAPGVWTRAEAVIVRKQLQVAGAPRALRVRHAWADHPSEAAPRTAHGEPLPTFELAVRPQPRTFAK